MNLKSAYRELRRIGVQYGSAVIRESNGNVVSLVPTLYKVLLARLRYDIGPRYYSLFELARLPRFAWSDFVTDDPTFKQLLLDMSPREAHDIANDKALFHNHCMIHALPAIPILCLVSDEVAHCYENVPRATTVADWHAAMANAPGELFVKALDGTFGEGAFSVHREGNLAHFAGRSGSLDDLYSYIRGLLVHERAWLVQPRLRSHDSIAGILSPRGLGTIRTVTCMHNGRARLLLAVMKITVGSNVTDNFHHGSTGNLVTSIDLETGTLSAARGSSRKDWPVMGAVTHHPDTGQSIEGFVLPFWNDVTELALKAQESLPQLKSAGWDIAVTNDGLVLVETNVTYSVDIMQVAYRRGLKWELMRELGLPVAGSTAAAPRVRLRT